jgi:AraC family transcriptional regulator
MINGHSVTKRCGNTGAVDSARPQGLLSLEYIEVHLEQDLTVGNLASVASLSYFHFAREFKLAVGKSPHQYVAIRRLGHAKTLLTQSERSLDDITQACGFSSAQ